MKDSRKYDMTLTDTLLLVYSDGKPHSNDELYKTADKYEKEHRGIGGEDLFKTVRGIQQTLKERRMLINVRRGYWMLHPDVEVYMQ